MPLDGTRPRSEGKNMNRKAFLRSMAAVAGSLAIPGSARAADFGAALQEAAAGGDAAFWKLIRDEFVLDPAWSYLNFGGLGTCPMPVLNAMWEWTRTEERAPSAGHDEALWWSVKERLARLLGPRCRKEDLALIGCATEGVNAIINGLPLKKGDEVITSTHEHVAVNVGLLNRMQRDGIVIRLFEPDLVRARGNVERIASLVNARPGSSSSATSPAPPDSCFLHRTLPASRVTRASGLRWTAPRLPCACPSTLSKPASISTRAAPTSG